MVGAVSGLSCHLKWMHMDHIFNLEKEIGSDAKTTSMPKKTLSLGFHGFFVKSRTRSLMFI